MSGWIRLLVAIAFGVSATVHAQDGLRSASLPERPIASPPPGPGDLFRARPDTYVPRSHPNRPRPRFPHGHGGGGPVYGHGGGWPFVGIPDAGERETSRAAEAETDDRPIDRGSASNTADGPADRAASPPPVVPRPAPHRTFYVIPRCYAGDRPPDASIPCDLTQLRTIR